MRICRYSTFFAGNGFSKIGVSNSIHCCNQRKWIYEQSARFEIFMVSEALAGNDYNCPQNCQYALKGTYVPYPVRSVEIPKPGGGRRLLKIPTVVDRFIRQALMQVLQKKWDKDFSPQSYGFRPSRLSASGSEEGSEVPRRGIHLQSRPRHRKVLRPGKS